MEQNAAQQQRRSSDMDGSPAAAGGSRASGSSGSSVTGAEESGDRFIKNTDDTRINRRTGTGPCALHPCLTRRATIAADTMRPPRSLSDPSDRERLLSAELEKCALDSAGGKPRDSSGGTGEQAVNEGVLKESKVSEHVAGAQRPPSDVHLQQTAGARSPAQSDTAPVTAGSQLAQKRRELALSWLRHPDATTQAVRTLERGLAEADGARGNGSGADTPTVDLVQTAVSVREVSKLIGRTVVQMSNVRRIMLVTKPNDTSLVSLTRDLAVWLVESPTAEGGAPMLVYIEEFIARHRSFGLQRLCQKHPALERCLQFWTPELCATTPEIFDFVVTLGGDGTVLYTSWLFQTTVPPVIPFHLGSLGFLTVFDHRHARRVLDSAIHSGVRINLRMRFTCTVYRLAEEAVPEHANVLVDAADCNRLISHEIATYGLQSEDEMCCDKDERNAAESAARLDAMNSMSASKRSSTLQRRRPSHSSVPSPQQQQLSSATAASQSTRPSRLPRAASRSHMRARSSSSSSSSDDALPPPPSSGSARRTPSSGSLGLARARSTRGIHSARANAAAVAAAAVASPNLVSTAASAAGTSSGTSFQRRLPSQAAETKMEEDGALLPDTSEWDDVPKAYRRRVRRVWKRDSTFQVMNEMVVDRGPSPYLSQIELYGDGNHLTTVEADGLCLATPTGSTAYSLAAGGSLVHPEIPAILVTPICPHTLSFRPMLLPDSMVLRVVVPPDSRNTAWASFDGRHRTELRRGDHIQITASKYPLPTVCASQSQTQDWTASLSRCLNWNERKRQMQLKVPPNNSGTSNAPADTVGAGCLVEDEEDDNVGDEGSDADV
ncbi:hypothetical protein H4R24_001080 [Coemansia sp. RSA 988]|nr:hypothetical protein H4R24_001080 [Coemansia sp. RSA 988]